MQGSGGRAFNVEETSIRDLVEEHTCRATRTKEKSRREADHRGNGSECTRV